MSAPAPLLEMRGITKTFPGVRALDGVSFDLRTGEIHALVGENGAGKSTLMKVLSGIHPHPTYDGEILVEGQTRTFRGVRDAEQAGIAVVHQELSVVGELSVGENIFLGRIPNRFGVIQWEELYSLAADALRQVRLDVEPHTPVSHLGIGQQYLVEIAKALSREARILVLDEPTAALTGGECEVLFAILEGLRARGVGIVYISHKLDEVFRLSDRVTVLRDGKTVGTERSEALDERTVIARMVGREISELFPAVNHSPGEIVFEAHGITAEDPNVAGKRVVREVSFVVRRGEVVGLAGMVGAGRSELLMTIFGAHPGKTLGEVRVEGSRVEIRHPRDAIEHGMGFVTEDRKRFGLLLDQSILDNMTLASLKRFGRWLTDVDAEAATCEKASGELRIKAPSLFVDAGTLSGGNQQKVVFSKWLLTGPKVLFLDEPTRGIDVGAKKEIYDQINRLAAQGLAIVLVSSELPEVLALSDRVLVMHEGSIAGEFGRDEATPEVVMACATGRRKTA